MERISCDSLPPSDFKLLSSADDSVNIENAIQVAVENCQLCKSTKRQFHCSKCVNSGRFRHTNDASDGERYSEKLKRWHMLKNQRSLLLSRIESAVKSSSELKAKAKSQQIFEAKSNIEALGQLLKIAKQNHDKDVVKHKTIVEENRHRSKKAERHQEKMNHISSYISRCILCTDECNMKIAEYQERICQLKCQHLQHLQQYIFPITQVLPRTLVNYSRYRKIRAVLSLSQPSRYDMYKMQQQISDTDHMAQSMVSALAEARHTSYIRGRWVYTDTSGELHFCIVEPSLPGSGDISSSVYKLWLTENQGSMKGPDEEPDPRNPIYTTCAALSYVTQILTLIAHFLDVNLPCHLCYSKFYQELTESQFHKAINFLNHNILYLCFTQDVSQDLVSPRHTMHNLVALLRSHSLGRTGAFLTNTEMIQSLYDLPIGADPQDLSSSTSSDSSIEESNEDLADSVAATGDWEHVSCTMPEVIPSSPPSAISSMSNTQLASRFMAGGGLTSTSGSIAGGLVTSAAAGVTSLWRFATGKGDKS